MATLEGQSIASSYEQLLSLPDGGGNTTTLVAITDGDAGTTFCLQIATTSALIAGSGSKLLFSDNGGEYISGDGTDLTITSGNDIVLAVGAAGSVHSAGVAGTSNTVLGVDAGIGLEAGSNFNVFIGDLVGDSSLNDAIWNVGVGYAALSSLTTGDRNTAVGYQALTTCSTGEENVAIGRGSLDAAVSSSYNIAIGTNALGTVDDGETFNIAIGYDAMGNANHADIDSNIAIGGYALDAIGINAQTGTIAIGHQALTALTSGAANTAVGYRSQTANTTGAWNTTVGYDSGIALTAGSHNNTALGYNALIAGNHANTDDNTCIGSTAGDSITSGSDNTIIGSEADTSAATGVNQTVVGYATTGVADNSVTLGNSDVTAVYMSSDSQALVHSAGIQFAGTQVANAGANVLDDYEEGSYTPTITESGDQTPTADSASSKLSYTKIGRLVTVLGTLQIDDIDGGAGYLEIGLPFTPKASDAGTGHHASYVGTYAVDVLGDGVAMFAQIEPSVAYVSLSAFRDGSSSVAQISTGYYRFQIQFEV